MSVYNVKICFCFGLKKKKDIFSALVYACSFLTNQSISMEVNSINFLNIFTSFMGHWASSYMTLCKNFSIARVWLDVLRQNVAIIMVSFSLCTFVDS